MDANRLRYGFFTCGVTIGILCVSLLLLREVLGIDIVPANVYYLLALPPLWLYCLSEYHHAKGRTPALSRDAAMVLLSVLLVLYAVPSFVQFLLLPGYTTTFAHYFQHAPVALIIGIIFIRLHALGGRAYLIFIGVTVEVLALFFFVTRMIVLLLGEFSPSSTGKTFEFFAIVATLLSYFLLLTTSKNGFLKKALVKLGDIQDEWWPSVRNLLFPLLLGACHLLFFVSLSDPAGQQFIGILFLFLAGLWVYTGHRFHNVFFYSLGYVEIVAAIFSCRFFDAIWSETWIMWLLLVVFLALIPIHRVLRNEQYRHTAGNYYAWLIVTAILVIYEHMSFYGLYSKLGILPLFLLWIMTFFVVVPLAAREFPAFSRFLGGLIYAPAFFFFLQQGPPSLMHLPRTLLATVLISFLIVAYRVYSWQWLSDRDVKNHRIVHHLHWFLVQPHSLIAIFMSSTLVVFVIHVLEYVFGPELFARQFFSMLLVQGTLIVYWFDLARKDRKWWWTIAAETMIVGMIFTLRQDLPLIFHLPWTVNWDLAVGVFIAFAITAARPLLKHQDRSIRIPIRFTLFGLPIITVMYAFDYDVGFEALSRVILLYSVLFIWQAYSEKDRFVLSYAFLGINSYLIMLFLHNEIHSLQAYITPVCISILILVQVFRDITSRATANIVRGTALFILLGTALFEAIVNNYTSALSHSIVITLSILSVVAAVFLRIRIFASIGLFCFLVDMIAIVYIVLSQQNTETLKVILGLGFTVGGGLILTGYILYRKNKEPIESVVNKLKKTFYSWE